MERPVSIVAATCGTLFIFAGAIWAFVDQYNDIKDLKREISGLRAELTENKHDIEFIRDRGGVETGEVARLLARDYSNLLRGARGKTGPKGDRGEAGPKGPQGEKGFVDVSGEVSQEGLKNAIVALIASGAIDLRDFGAEFFPTIRSDDGCPIIDKGGRFEFLDGGTICDTDGVPIFIVSKSDPICDRANIRSVDGRGWDGATPGNGVTQLRGDHGYKLTLESLRRVNNPKSTYGDCYVRVAVVEGEFDVEPTDEEIAARN